MGSEPSLRLSFEWFEGPDALSRLTDPWSQIVARMARPRFLHLPQWYRAFTEAFETTQDAVFFLLVELDGVPSAILPLRRVRRRIGGARLRVIEIPHNDHVPLCDLVGAESKISSADLLRRCLEAIRDRFRSRYDVILLPRAIEGSCLYQFATSVALPRMISEPDKPCDVLPVMPHGARLKALSKNFRKSLRRARQRAGKLENVSYFTAVSLAELHEAFPEFLEVEASGWKGAQGSAILAHSSLRTFYSGLIDGFGPSRSCEINLMRVGEECVAGQFALITDESYYLLKIGYRETAADIAPGNVLLEHLLERLAAEKRVRSVNLLTDSEWHTKWRPSRSATRKCRIFATTAGGSLGLWMTRLKLALKPSYHAVLVRMGRRSG